MVGRLGAVLCKLGQLGHSFEKRLPAAQDSRAAYASVSQPWRVPNRQWGPLEALALSIIQTLCSCQALSRMLSAQATGGPLASMLADASGPSQVGFKELSPLLDLLLVT